MKAETPLIGGRVTAGVVRVGDTVRRPASIDRPLQRDVLSHLEREGFDGTPRFLGIDEHGRDTLSYLPGQVPDDLAHFSDAQLAAAAILLRRFHDATSNAGAVRQCGAEVICHNDWGPPNAVFRDGLPYGIIDFDTLAPGLRLWDLGYSAFSWLDLGNPDYKAAEQVRRLAVFSKGYGLAWQTALAVSAGARGKADIAEWAASAATWTVLNITERLMPTGYSF